MKLVQIKLPFVKIDLSFFCSNLTYLGTSSCYFIPVTTPGKQPPDKAGGVVEGEVQEYIKLPRERATANVELLVDAP